MLPLHHKASVVIVVVVKENSFSPFDVAKLVLLFDMTKFFLLLFYISLIIREIFFRNFHQTPDFNLKIRSYPMEPDE